MRNLIIIVLSIVLVVLGLSWVKQSEELKQDRVRYAELLHTTGKTQVIKEYIRDSIKHTVFVEKKVKDTDIEKRLAISTTYADSLERALKISLSKIYQVTKVNAELDAKLQLIKHDDGTVTYQDKWLSLQYFPQREELSLKYDIALNVVRYNKRRWLLAEKKNYIDIFADDPRVTIKGLNSFTVEEKTSKRFGIGISTGYALTLNNNEVLSQPYIGFGINYNIINF